MKQSILKLNKFLKIDILSNFIKDRLILYIIFQIILNYNITIYVNKLLLSIFLTVSWKKAKMRGKQTRK